MCQPATPSNLVLAPQGERNSDTLPVPQPSYSAVKRPRTNSACGTHVYLDRITRAPAIPAELKLRIIEEVGRVPPGAFRLSQKSVDALLSLSLVDKTFQRWTEPVLYRHITVSINRISLLNETLYRGALRPPLKALGSLVKSFLLLDTITDEKPDANDESVPDSIDGVLRWIAPYVQQVLLRVVPSSSACDILESMPDLRTLGFSGIGGVQRLPRIQKARRLVLFLPLPFDEDTMVASIAWTAVEDMVLCVGMHAASSMPVFLKALLMNCPKLRRVILTPLDPAIWLPEIPSYVGGSLRQRIRGLLKEDTVFRDCSGAIEVVSPAWTNAFKLWCLHSINSGDVWTMKTVPMVAWADPKFQVARPRV